MRTKLFLISAVCLISVPAHGQQKTGGDIPPIPSATAPHGDAQQAAAETQPPDGSISFSGGAVSAGLGYVWGNGKLRFDDKEYRFGISGLSVLDVGGASLAGSGEVYNLKKLSDFAGNYVAVSAGLTVGGGGSVAYLQNEHGVTIALHSTTVGLRFNFAVNGVRVTLKS